jgi:3-oxoacyl-[acyl-carrier-protein] synthase-3
VIFINGVGFALPETVIDNEFLAALGSDGVASQTASDIGIRSRRTTLPLSYLRNSRNRDISKAIAAANESPTDLGARAAQMALDCAGVAAADIGLIVASCINPWQTIPAEAARIAQRLGIKLPAYDINGTGVELPFFINLMNSWKEERVPEILLFIATHAPTQRIVYDGGAEGAIFGDAAGAVVLSNRRIQGLQVNEVSFLRQRFPGAAMSIFEPLKLDLSQVLDTTVSRTMSLLEKFGNQRLAGKRFVLTQLAPKVIENTAQSVGVSSKSCTYSSEQYGYGFGASAIIALAESWDEVSAGGRLLIAEAGVGEGFGYVELERCCTY